MMEYKIIVEGLQDSRQAAQLRRLLEQADATTAVSIHAKQGLIEISTDQPLAEVCTLIQGAGFDIVDAELQ